ADFTGTAGEAAFSCIAPSATGSAVCVNSGGQASAAAEVRAIRFKDVKSNERVMGELLKFFKPNASRAVLGPVSDAVTHAHPRARGRAGSRGSFNSSVCGCARECSCLQTGS